MAFTLDSFKAMVDSLIAADNTELSALARYRCIKAAVERYSIDAPNDYTEDEAGDAGKFYDLTGENAKLAYWVDGFSRVISIEYPAATIASDEQPQYLEPEDWDDDYWAGGIHYLYLLNHAPAATDTMRIRFTVPYSWEASAVTTSVSQTTHGFSVSDYIYQDSSTWYEATDSRIATHQVSAVADANSFTAKILQADPPNKDFFAICHLAAAECCRAIAAKYSRTSDSSIAADSVNHPTRATEFSARAKEFMGMYEKHMGIGQEVAVKAGGAFADMDSAPGWPSNRQYLFHRNR